MTDQPTPGSHLKQAIAMLLLGVVLVFAIVNRLSPDDATPAPHAQADSAHVEAPAGADAQGGQSEAGLVDTAQHAEATDAANTADVVDEANTTETPEASADAHGVVDAAVADAHGEAPVADAHGEAAQGEAEHGGAAHGGGHTVPDVQWYWILPFALLLGSIAVCPLINMHFWEHHYPKIAIVLGLITAGYYLFFFHDLPSSRTAWLHEMQEYVSFIALLGSLYIVSGGIMIKVSRKATATTNTSLLLVGAVIANVVGTTGAAMLLIRPYIRINKDHIKPYHIIFFIFAVANCGGSLSPIGDPPLFMGYLKGVPFFWVLEALWPMWAVCLAVLLTLFFIIDKRDHAKAERVHEKDPGPAVQIYGFQNFLYIGLILAGVFRPSMFEHIREGEWLLLPISREIMMLIAAVASKLSTKPYIYERNEFTYGPIKEVAILFVGIFSTMVPALNYLNHHSSDMPLKTPGQYYYMTGVLSSMLDNAPTYLVFLETKQGQVQNAYGPEIEHLREIIDNHVPGEPVVIGDDMNPVVAKGYDTLVQYNQPKIDAGTVTDADIRIAMIIGDRDLAMYLIAISIGAVFFGACTYIGNGPNFMVKSIAESAGIQMPSFFGYVFKYALPILIPIYILVWFLFFVLKLAL
jgi:Na+/H+ antiporter NhaD/arsenite permease-like protein